MFSSSCLNYINRGIALFIIVSCDRKVPVQSLDQRAKCEQRKLKEQHSLFATLVRALEEDTQIPNCFSGAAEWPTDETVTYRALTRWECGVFCS